MLLLTPNGKYKIVCDNCVSHRAARCGIWTALLGNVKGVQIGQILHIARGSTGREIYVMEDAQSKSKSVIMHFSFSVLAQLDGECTILY